MSRYYVMVGLDIPGHFRKGASTAEEAAHASRLVAALLKSGLAERDIDIDVAVIDRALSADDVDRITLALHADLARGPALEELDIKWQRQLAELRRATDKFVAEREAKKAGKP